MSKKDKNKKNTFIFDGFDDFNLDQINFKEIGNTIKNSVNRTLKKFTDSLEKEKLPQTRNPEVCAQKPPEVEKARGLQVLSFIAPFILAPFGISLINGGFGFIQFLIGLILLMAAVAVTVISRQASKEYLRLTNNYVRFLHELGNNTVISIRDLASSVQQSEEKTVSDLIKMMKRGYFHQARIVEDDSLFLLDIPTFKLYKEKRNEMPESRRARLDNEEISAEEISLDKAYEIIDKGKVYLKDIENHSAKILNEDFKKNTSQVIKNSSDILTIVERYPDKSYALNKFIDYYLPTTSKLVESYEEFEMMNTSDPKILKSMEEINTSIVTIAEAFDKIKIELLSDRAMDVKTDIDTINLLLNQEGYTEDDRSNK